MACKRHFLQHAPQCPSILGGVVKPHLPVTSIFMPFSRTLANNHPRGCYGVTGGVERARKLAMRRAPRLYDIGGRVGDVDPREPPARTRARLGLTLI
ncbi:jg13688 [Pararge aegeria aegeria]|uniref:Jg13688 protein n=1 Tax=Pararge aegeria aegeria TaxID=348720 RepID=A0A8S4RNC3_9NEOP|nr:jg13688 [Pararge aegeria aegeria]